MRTFESDLELGHKAEEYILKKLQLIYPTMRRIEGKNVHFDLIDDSGLTIEVKLDLKSRETEKIAVEFMHRGVPSGISISKANRWILVYYCKGWGWSMMETDSLRAYIKRNNKQLDRYVGEGDKSSLVFLKASDIKEIFNFYPIER